MTLPTYETLAGLDREQLWGLIEQCAGPAWAATYEHRWERMPHTWQAVTEALDRAAAGERATVPAAKPPRYLLPLVRERLALLSTSRNQNGPFGEVRLLERLGLVQVDHDDTYVLAVVGGLGDRWAAKDRAAILRADPELLDVVWRFFEVEGGGEVSLTNVDKFSVGTDWKQVLGELVTDGTLPRERVLVCCVQALGRDFSAYRAGWFSAFLDSLSPDADELAALQPQLRRLLGSPLTATASLAARALKVVAAAGLLDDDSCQDLAPALVGRTKGTALETLRLLRGIAQRRTDLTRIVAETATAGLEHPHPDVQRAAVSLLDALGAADLAARSAGLLAPTVRGQVTGNAGRGPVPGNASAHADGAPPVAAGRCPAPIDLTPAALPVPSGADLTELVAALLEDAEDPLMVEPALAGLAATDDRGLLAALTKRATTLLKRDGFRGDHPVRAGFARLVLIAAGAEDRSRRSLAPDLPELLRDRLDHVTGVVAGRTSPRVLLATPSDTDGWVDPEAFVARLATNPEPPLADLVGGLLRLAPNDRSGALNAFAKHERTDETGDIVRHALGAPPPVSGAAAVRTPAPWDRGLTRP